MAILEPPIGAAGKVQRGGSDPSLSSPADTAVRAPFAIAGIMSQGVAATDTAGTNEVLGDALVWPVCGQEFRHENGIGPAGGHTRNVPSRPGYQPKSVSLLVRDRSNDRIDGADDFLDGRVPSELHLGEDEVVANHDLEDTTP